MNKRLARVLALLPWCLSACASSPTTEAPGRGAFPAGESEAHAPQGDPTLYGWDGSVVAGESPGQVSQRANPGHGLEPTIEGRMHILELYQSVLDERDALATEVQALTKALERTETDLAVVRGEKAELETRIAWRKEKTPAPANAPDIDEGP